jgi:enterochelin esterase family protein
MPPVAASPEITADGNVTLRIDAPRAESVQLAPDGDFPTAVTGKTPLLTRDENGIWTLTLKSVPPGAYRYAFLIDGATVLDPRNPKTSESNENPWSLAVVPGADWMDTRDVPHGAVSEVTYWSSTLRRFRRLHVYTPPGYESGDGRYPVLYLLHGALDSDNSWSTVGRAGFILDNLIAAGRAKPMVMVMPHGHTGPFRFGMPMSGEFEPEFLIDIQPQMEQRYRLLNDRKHRALAGLSMGGYHTLNIGIPHLDRFGYLGVFSSGIFGLANSPSANPAHTRSFEDTHQVKLTDPQLKEGLHLLWMAIGRDDILLETSRHTVALLRKYHFNVVYRETEGGHTWDQWREYLHEFVPDLFRCPGSPWNLAVPG